MMFIMDIILFTLVFAEVVELVDALDSGSSGLFARRGSSPLFGTIFKEDFAKCLQTKHSFLHLSP